MFKIITPGIEQELNEREMRRLLTVAMERLSDIQARKGLNETELQLATKIQIIRTMNRDIGL